MSASISVMDATAGSSQSARRPQPPLLSELGIANRQRDALYLLSEQLHRANSIDEIYSAAMDAIESALNCERSAILLFDDAGIMQFVAWSGLSEDYRAAVTGHSPWQTGETDAQPIAIADVAASDLDEKLKVTVLGEGIGAVAFIPLVSDGALIGKFMAYFREPYAFTKDDVAVSLVIARQLAFAIQRHRTSAQLAEELNATRLLQALSIELAHEVDVEALYEKSSTPRRPSCAPISRACSSTSRTLGNAAN